MKKSIANIGLMAVILLMCILLSGNIFVYALENENTINNFDYILNDNNTITITKYLGTDTKVIIPENISGITVTAIGENAFYNNTNLVQVILPDTIIEIGESSFEKCTDLQKLYLGNSIKKINEFAFSNCTKLRNINLPDSLMDIGIFAFQECTSLGYIKIPNGISTIREYTFENCAGLTNVQLPDFLNIIEVNAFSGCIKLMNIQFPNSLKKIESGAFYGCTNLKNIKITNNIVNIGYHVFEKCSNSIIYGLKNSYVEVYARENNIRFRDYTTNKENLSNYIATLSETTCDYTGKAKKPKVIVKAGSEILVLSKDYKVMYSNNIKLGTATVKITGIGNYEGTIIKNFKISLAAPKISKIQNGNSYQKLIWNKVTGATSYRVYKRKDTNTGWDYLGTTKDTIFINKNVKKGKNYTYTVKAFYGNIYGRYNTKGVQFKYLNIPIAKITNGKAYQKISWNKVEGAASYCIYQKIQNQWILCAKVSNTSYINKTVSSGNNYIYAVRACSENMYSTYKTVTSKYLAVPTLMNIFNNKNDQFLIWKSVKGAKKYKVYYKISGASKWKYLATTTALSYNNKKVVKGKKYVYTVVAITDKEKSYYDCEGLILKF